MSNIKAFIVSWWQSYADKHPKLTKLIIQFVKFYLISLLV
ncbi:MAG: hypothetical protein K0R31_2318, partial [Clostridiales bacterium]|nr:hypothetical protein [Clostridiales bacterium]